MSAPARITGGVPLGDALAEELMLASRMLGELAYDLGGDEAVLRRHLTSLQTIDHVTQMLIITADLLRTADVDGDPLSRVTLHDMLQRLQGRAA